MNFFSDWFQNVVILGNSLRQWTIAGILLCAVAATAWFVRKFLRRRLRAAVGTSERSWIELGLRLVRGLKGWFLALFAVYVATIPLALPDDLRRFIRSVMTVAYFAQFAVWADVMLAHVIQNRARRRLAVDASSATTLQILGFCARVVVWVVAVLMTLENLGINVTALMAGLGIGGIAVAFAAQSVLRDVFGSFSIMFDRPFALGDFIIVGQTMGTVENIGLRTTRLRSISGEQIIVSNNDLLSSRISNYRQLRDRRALFTLNVAYDTPPKKLELIPRIVREAIEAQEQTRFDRSHFKEFGPTALLYENVYFFTSPDFNRYMDAQQAINLAIIRRFGEEGIKFALTANVAVPVDSSADGDARRDAEPAERPSEDRKPDESAAADARSSGDSPAPPSDSNGVDDSRLRSPHENVS